MMQGRVIARLFSSVEKVEKVSERVFEKFQKTNAPFGVKYGKGRQSTNGITATVFGGTGFLGRYFLNELGSCGTRVYLPYRGCELEIRHIKQMFDIGQLGPIPFSPRDRESMIQSLQYSDVVINMIGKHHETKHIVPTRRADGSLSRINYDFEDVNVRIPETIAELCAEAGVKCLIHVSALSADEDSKSIWNQTKARGEIAVRNKFPDAIIVKPATVFGAEDRFLNYIAETSKRTPFFPLLNDGAAVLQPVWAGDVAKALMEIIYGHEHFAGRDFQLTGPNEYTYKELVEFVSDVTDSDINMMSVPVPLAKKFGKAVEFFNGPVVTEDSVEQMLEDNVARTNPNLLTFADLDLTPVSVDKKAFDYLARFRSGGHFRLVEGYH